MSSDNRIVRRFTALAKERRGGLVTFITAGDPDLGTSMAILRGLPKAGADLIEIGMPFSDPMADGPAVQASSLRALKAGQTLKRTIGMVAALRSSDNETPIILMGYYNPIYVFGVKAFVAEARKAGVDGLIIVDLPPEECTELLAPARAAGIDLIFLVAPTTDDRRLPAVLSHARGFLYYVSITGVTGTASPAIGDVGDAVSRLRHHTKLPIAVGFGIRSPDQAAAVASLADACVVGSALVSRIADHLDDQGQPRPGLTRSVLAFVGELSRSVRAAGRTAPA
ncbi:MAG: tryptophan synthase subunit alpha [Rhodospirillales bacterium]|nr:tryptophan synthase subunit alpha [Rhodospirillales bacterium]